MSERIRKAVRDHLSGTPFSDACRAAGITSSQMYNGLLDAGAEHNAKLSAPLPAPRAETWCAWCGSDDMRHNKVCCSVECWREYIRDRAIAKARDEGRVCVICDTPILAHDPRRQTCSPACSDERYARLRAQKRPPAREKQHWKARPKTCGAWFPGLETLVAMVEAEGSGRAAEKLGTTRSAIMGQLRKHGVSVMAAYKERLRLGLPGTAQYQRKGR